MKWPLRIGTIRGHLNKTSIFGGGGGGWGCLRKYDMPCIRYTMKRDGVAQGRGGSKSLKNGGRHIWIVPNIDRRKIQMKDCSQITSHCRQMESACHSGGSYNFLLISIQNLLHGGEAGLKLSVLVYIQFKWFISHVFTLIKHLLQVRKN